MLGRRGALLQESLFNWTLMVASPDFGGDELQLRRRQLLFKLGVGKLRRIHVDAFDLRAWQTGLIFSDPRP